MLWTRTRTCERLPVKCDRISLFKLQLHHFLSLSTCLTTQHTHSTQRERTVSISISIYIYIYIYIYCVICKYTVYMSCTCVLLGVSAHSLPHCLFVQHHVYMFIWVYCISYLFNCVIYFFTFVIISVIFCPLAAVAQYISLFVILITVTWRRVLLLLITPTHYIFVTDDYISEMMLGSCFMEVPIIIHPYSNAARADALRVLYSLISSRVAFSISLRDSQRAAEGLNSDQPPAAETQTPTHRARSIRMLWYLI